MPSGWVNTDFEKVLSRIVGGGTPSKANAFFFNGKIPFMTVKDMTERFPSDTVDHISEEAIEASATSFVPADTLIVATRMSLGKVVRPRFETAINQDLKALFLADGIDKTFIEHWWRSRSSLIQRLGTGTTVQGIRLEDIRALSIDIPPLNEQKRIADKLDAVLARVDACRDRLDRIPNILKRFRQSVLAAAVTGRLTTDFRNEAEYQLTKFDWEIPESWRLVTINEVAEVKGGKRLPNGKALVSNDTGYPYIRAGQLKNGTVVPDGQLYLTEDVQLQIARYIVNSGDVYITIVGACIGDAGIIPASYEGANLTENAAKLCSFKKSISSSFLSFWLRSQLLQEIIQSEIKSGAQGKLALMRIKTLPFPYPSIDEQEEIVRRVESLFAYADRLEARYAVARAQVEKLTPALLAKAFRGELVPQDPNDEPAGVLLARIATPNLGKIVKRVSFK